MELDTIVRRAAQAALASSHPVRVVDERRAGRHRRRRRDPPGRRGRGRGQRDEPARAAAAWCSPARQEASGRPPRDPVALAVGTGRDRPVDPDLGNHQGSGHAGSSAARTHRRSGLATGFRDDVLASRDSNPIIQLTYDIGAWFVDAVEWLQGLISVPDFPRPVPQIGWLGVTAVATWIGFAIANWRIALLVAGSFLSFGAFGYWSDAMDLLIITFLAVALAVIIGMPLAVLMGTGNRVVTSVLTTLLDIMQTLPTFVYLLPIVLFFGIGGSAAVVCTLIYAVPPLIGSPATASARCHQRPSRPRTRRARRVGAG